MADNPDEVYHDALTDSVSEGKSNSQKEDSEYVDLTDFHHLYYELEQNEESSANSDSCSQDEEEAAQKSDNKPAKTKMKKINAAIKSKIDDLNLGHMFGRKTNADKQDKNGHSHYSFVINGKQGKVKANLEQNPSEPQAASTTEDGATSFASDYEVAICSNTGNNLPQISQPAANNRGNNAPSDVRSVSVPAVSYQTWPEYSFAEKNAGPLYELAQPIPTTPKKTDTIISAVSYTPSANKGCLEGVGPAIPVDFRSHLQKDEKSLEYERLNFRSCEGFTESLKERLKIRDYSSLASLKSKVKTQRFENQDVSSVAGYQDDDGYSLWGSEFDETSSQDEVPPEMEEQIRNQAPDKPLPPKPRTKETVHSEVEELIRDEAPNKPLPPKPGTKAYLKAKSTPNDQTYADDPSSTACLPVTINPEKHPPPALPPQPNGLTQNQIKRRMVIESIIMSERSFLESLERVIKEYEKPVLELVPQNKSNVRLVFAAMKEVISHHKMFQIELSECVKTWDQKERIGDIFTASFSKTMLINAYSIYVNSFAAAMEEIRSLQRSKHVFQDFLLRQEKLSSDRLSIFGLMVKPVQRFPQFIMFLQDLIRFTPQNHSDRRALQLALTELENVAYRLNERKRQSEQKFQANQTVQQLMKQKVQHMLVSWNLDLDPDRKLIRTDTVEQVVGECENMKSKTRRLILMNDLVLCVKVVQKEQSGHTVERLLLRWMAKIKDLELKDTAITPDMQSVIKQEPGKFHIISSQPEKPEDDPFHLYADLHDMVHDHTVLGQISALLSTLKCSYASHGLREELVYEVSRDLQRMIQIKEEQLRLVNSCSIILQDSSRSDKPHYVLQTQTAATKQEWCTDFMMAKLSLDKSNFLAWDGASGTDNTDFDVTPAHFMKYLPVDVPKNFTKIKCAVSIFLNREKADYAIGVQHLWVCSSTPTHGQVSVLSIHNSKPSLMESFKASSSDILSAELVPGCGETMKPMSFLFPEDTVWITTSHREILIFPLTSEDGVHRQPLAVLRTLAVTVSMKFVDERLFCGFDDGFLTVYSRRADGSWNTSEPAALTFGTSCVRLHFVHEENIWLSCANKLSRLEIDSLKTQAIFVLNSSHDSPVDQVVKSGVGIWVSFHDSSVIKLFHLETMENLQEISVGNFVNRIRTEKLWSISGGVVNLVVTSLSVTRGLLWVGTSLGVVLTVPLPRLSDGVPLYRGRPKVSLHAHRGPVKFVIPLHCSTNIQEMTRASSLRPTLSARQSIRNLEREKLELEESEKRKERINKAESTRSFDVTIHGTEAESEYARNPSASSNVPVLKKIFTEGDIAKKGRNISSSITDNKPEVARKSKTLSFRTELARRILKKSNTISRSDFGTESSDALEVEELYDILLEDTGMEESEDDDDEDDDDDGDDEEEDNFRVTSLGRGKQWSSDNMLPAKSSDSSSKQEVPSWLNMVPSDHSNCELKQNVKERLPTHSRSPYPIPASVPHPENRPRSNSACDPLLPRDFTRDRTSRLTTIRRASSNAVIVLSGGDGYCDLDLSRSQLKVDDACVLLWVHKF